MTKKTLSDKRFIEMGVPEIGKYYEKDIKEAVKRLKDEMKGKKIGKLHKVISKVFGKELVK